jgi:lipase maturation factor 1
VKVTLESGIVKLTAGDASWWPDLTALTYHYWTQPLPAWTSVFIDRAPLRVHQAACVAMFALELGVPLLAFGPRRARHVAAAGMIALQLGLAVAGNYAYFNLLCAVLCVPLLGEAPAQRWRPVLGWSAFGAVTLFSALVFGQQFRPPYPAPLKAALVRLQTFNVLHSYGVFRVMTKTRPEIIFEGSNDGVTWKTYELKWKPGRVDRRPEFVAPWQPRLDWQLWFAAMGDCERWVQLLLQQLLLGTPEVLALLEENPFAGAPPRYLRTTLYEYRFAPSGSADWWTRTEEGPYCPPVMLDAQGGLVRAQ